MANLTYNEEIGKEICFKLSTSNKGIQRLCKENPHWPCFQTIYEWRIKVKSFGEMYTQAKRDQVELLVDECIDIADDVSNDTITKETKDGKEYEVCNNEWINRSRLRIDTRKWLAAKLAPRVYGDAKPEEEKDTLKDDVAFIRNLIQSCLDHPKI